MPWFAPEFYTKNIWTITVRFREDEPYCQLSDSVLEIEDIEEIKRLLERWYVKEDFKEWIENYIRNCWDCNIEKLQKEFE